MCVTGNKTIDTVLVVGLTIGATVVAGPEAGWMVYAAIGAASGAAMAGAQGRDPLTGAIIGGITGGMLGGVDPTATLVTGAAKEGIVFGASQATGTALLQAGGHAITQAGATAMTNMALGTAAAGAFGLMMPGAPSATGHTPLGQVNQYQAFRQMNMNTNIATTGSGGRQAAKSLAAAISRTKKRKLTQRDIGDLSLSTESFTNTGLQLA